MFDDHCCQITGGGTYVSPTGPSRGLVIKLNPQTHQAGLVAQYGRGNFDAEYMGNTQPLPNGNVMVGWGSQPYFSEYSHSGQLLLDAVLPHPDQSYRATLQHWVGEPLYPPVGAVRKVGGKTVVYASWNGATQIHAWKVLAGNGSGPMQPAAAALRNGFETSIVCASRVHHLQGRGPERPRQGDRDLGDVQVGLARLVPSQPVAGGFGKSGA